MNSLQMLEARFHASKAQIWSKYTASNKGDLRCWLELKRNTPRGPLDMSQVVVEWAPEKPYTINTLKTERVVETKSDVFNFVVSFWMNKKMIKAVNNAADAFGYDAGEWPPPPAEEPTKKELARVAWVGERLELRGLLDPRSIMRIKTDLLEALIATRDLE